jgi:hypothetical protein
MSQPTIDREAFEEWISSPPYEKSIARLPESWKAWSGHYADYYVQLAWEAWCESARQEADRL